MNKTDYIKTCEINIIKISNIFISLLIKKKYIIYIKNYKIKIKNQRWDHIMNKNHYKKLAEPRSGLKIE